MTTSKLLQTPKIIEIIGSTIRIAHPDISNNVRTQLSAEIAAAGTTATVVDNYGFADNDWFIVGEKGDQTTEENDVNGAVTRGTSITVTNALSYAHSYQAPVTKIYERGIKIYGAATDGGAGTLIASIDAKTAATRQLADAQMIEWNKQYTEYTLISTDTTYAYYFVKFTDGTTDSTASAYVLATGLTSSSVEYMINQALALTDTKLGEFITRDECIRWANDAQSAITQYMYQDPRNGRLKQMDWDFEILEDKTSLTISENENEYALSGLTVPAKYTDTNYAVINLRIGDLEPLIPIGIKEMDDLLANKPRTNVATEAAAAAITLVVDSNIEYADSGTLYVGTDEVTYTGKTGTTTFTGIPASGTGAITETWVVDTPVWQGAQPGTPTRYTIFNGTLILDYPPSDDYASYALKLRYYKALTALTTNTSTTDVNFTNVFQYYIAALIYLKKEKFNESELMMSKFNKMVLDNAQKSHIYTKDTSTRYDFTDPYDL